MPSKARDNHNQKYFIHSVIFTLRNGIYLELKQRSKIDYAEFGNVWTVGKYNYIQPQNDTIGLKVWRWKGHKEEVNDWDCSKSHNHSTFRMNSNDHYTLWSYHYIG